MFDRQARPFPPFLLRDAERHRSRRSQRGSSGSRCRTHNPAGRFSCGWALASPLPSSTGPADMATYPSQRADILAISRAWSASPAVSASIFATQRTLSDRAQGAAPTVRPRTRAIKAVGRCGTGLKSAALQPTCGKFRELPIRLNDPDSREEIG
jgi:hypothetical protein